MKDYEIESDLIFIDKKIMELKLETGTAVYTALAELYKAKAQLISVQIALENMEKYEKLMKKEDGQ